jgi:hypothetical protein
MTVAPIAGSATRRTRTQHPQINGLTLVQLNNSLWRVLAKSGSVRGYIELVPAEQPGATDRYRAKRLMPNLRTFLSLGEFWEIRDAVDCLRFA